MYFLFLLFIRLHQGSIWKSITYTFIPFRCIQLLVGQRSQQVVALSHRLLSSVHISNGISSFELSWRCFLVCDSFSPLFIKTYTLYTRSSSAIPQMHLSLASSFALLFNGDSLPVAPLGPSHRAITEQSHDQTDASEHWTLFSLLMCAQQPNCDIFRFFSSNKALLLVFSGKKLFKGKSFLASVLNPTVLVGFAPGKVSMRNSLLVEHGVLSSSLSAHWSTSTTKAEEFASLII